MLKRSYSITLLLVFTHLLLFGCAKPPTEEMIKAEKVIDEARQKEADIYAHDIFMRAVGSFSRAKELVAAKKYDEAKQIAIVTVQMAEQAGTVAEINKEKKRQRVEALHQEAENLRRTAHEAINDLRSLEKKSFRKSAAKKYEQLQEMVMTWETALTAVKESAMEEEMIQSTEELKKLLQEIETEKENVQASLIKKKIR